MIDRIQMSAHRAVSPFRVQGCMPAYKPDSLQIRNRAFLGHTNPAVDWLV